VKREVAISDLIINSKERSMSLAHTWLEQEPWPTKAMPVEMLEKQE
jgi:hypothetical protein